MQKLWFCTMTAILALACTSCGSSPRLYPVSGKVTYNGAPAAGAAVFFQRHDADVKNEQTIMGVAGEDGSFTLACGPYGEGAPAGEYDVFIEWIHRGDGNKRLKGIDWLKGQYFDRKRPLLHAVVSAGPNAVSSFDLKGPELAEAKAVQSRRETPKLKGFFLDGKPVDPDAIHKEPESP
jgi:hypothetical protein